MSRLDEHIARLQARNYPWPIPWVAVEALARSEDCRESAYQCTAGVWTIGWGETEGIRPDMRWTLDQCDARFFQQVRVYTSAVEAMCTLPPNNNQLGALVWLAYNIGLNGLRNSTVLRRHNEGKFEAAARAFALWNKVRDPETKQLVVSRGLTARRAREAALYLQPSGDVPQPRMPQAVEAESPMTQSPINRTAAALGVSGFASLLPLVESGKAVADKVTEFLGLPLPAVFAGVVVIGAMVIFSQRKKQRDEGWA